MNGCIKNKLYQFTERKKKIVIWNCPCERRNNERYKRNNRLVRQ